MKTALRGLLAWCALGVALVGVNTLVQIQRDPASADYTQVDGFVRLVLFGTFVIALLVIAKFGFTSVVAALTFGVIKPEKPAADPAVITFDIPETEEGNRTAANIVAGELFLVGLGLLLAGGAAGWAMLEGGGFTPQSAITFLAAGSAVYPLIPVAIRRVRDSGRTWPIEITFTPVGMSQPVGEGQRTVAWTIISGFVFKRRRGGRRVDAHIAISDERGRRQLLPQFAKASPHGFLMTSAMDAYEAERAEAAILRFQPGLVEWSDERVRRGGFGLGKRSGSVITRWPERKEQLGVPEEPEVVDREPGFKTVLKGIVAWAVAAVLVLALLTVIRNADSLASSVRFLAIAGAAVALVGALAGFITGWQAVLNRFLFRPRTIPRSQTLPADVVGFGVPDNARFFTRVLFSALNGVGLIVLGGGLVVVFDQAQIGDWSPILLGVAIFLTGLVLLGSIAFRHREVTKSIRVSVMDDGLRQPAAEDEFLVLSWDEIKEVVLDENIVGKHLAVHVALVDAEAVVLLHDKFRRPSKFGHLLTPTMPSADAERFATLVESLRPGLVRRPAREIDRGGFGIVAAARRTILRWKGGAGLRPEPRDGLVISKVVDSAEQRRAGFITLVATVVLGFAVISDSGIVVRIVAGVLGALMFWVTVVSLRRHQSQVIREVVLKARWITVSTLTSRTFSWSVRWADIEKVFLRRTAGTDVFHLVLRPAEQVGAYYPRERLAMPLGMKRESTKDILLAEIELTSEDVKLMWPVLRERTDVVFATEGIDDPDYLAGRQWTGDLN